MIQPALKLQRKELFGKQNHLEKKRSKKKKNNINSKPQRTKFTWNSGQTCVSPDYILVHPSIEEDLLRWINHFIDLYHQPATLANTSKIINPRHFERLVRLMDDPTIHVVREGKRSVTL